MRAVRDREIVVRVHVDDEGGTLVAADAPPTVAVTDGSGDEVVGVSAVTEEETGVYKATIPAQTQLDQLSVEWSVVVGGAPRTVRDDVFVVADRLVPLWRLREDAEMADLSTVNLLNLAGAVEDWFNNALNFPYCEESKRIVFNHPGGARLRVPGVLFPKSLIEATEGDTPLSAERLADIDIVDGAFEFSAQADWDFLVGTQIQAVWAQGRKRLWLTHGPSPEFDHGIPEDLIRAAITLARYTSRQSNYPERARSVQTEGAIINFSTPSWDRPTGLPDVDGAVNRYAIRAQF